MIPKVKILLFPPCALMRYEPKEEGRGRCPEMAFAPRPIGDWVRHLNQYATLRQCWVPLAVVSCMLLNAFTTHEGTPTPSSEMPWGWAHSLSCFLCCQDASGGAGEDKKEGSLSQAPLVQVALRKEQFHLHSWVLQRVIVHHLHLELVRSCPLHWTLSLGLWVTTGARSLHLGTAVLDAAHKPSDSSPWISPIHSTPVTEYPGWQTMKVLQARSRASQAAAADAGETKLCHASWPASGWSAAKARYQRCGGARRAVAPCCEWFDAWAWFLGTERVIAELKHTSFHWRSKQQQPWETCLKIKKMTKLCCLIYNNRRFYFGSFHGCKIDPLLLKVTMAISWLPFTLNFSHFFWGVLGAWGGCWCGRYHHFWSEKLKSKLLSYLWLDSRICNFFKLFKFLSFFFFFRNG